MEITPFSTRETTAGNGVVVLGTEGTLDMTTVNAFDARLRDFAAHGRNRVVIDMEKLLYISSAGIGALMGFIRQFRDRGGDIKIAGANPGVYRVFELMDLTGIFQFTNTIEDALKAFDEATHGNAA